MSFPFLHRPARDFEQLAACYERLAAWARELDDERLHGVEDEVSGWSPAQHMFHLALANQWIAGTVRKLLSREEGIERQGRPTWLGRLVLATGTIPRGKGKAPESLRPPRSPHREQIEAMLSRERSELRELESRSEEIRRAPGRIRHFVFGYLDATEWLHFATIHTRHHVKLIEAIESHRRTSPGCARAERSPP